MIFNTTSNQLQFLLQMSQVSQGSSTSPDPQLQVMDLDTHAPQAPMDTTQGQVIDLQPLQKGLQQIEDDLSIVDNQSFAEYITMLQDALTALPQATAVGVSTYSNMVVSLQALPTRMNPKNTISWANTLVQLSTAIEQRQTILQSKTQSIQVKETQRQNTSTTIAPSIVDIPQEQYIESIFKYVQHRNALELHRRTQTLTASQSRLLSSYKVQGLIERSIRSQHPTWPLQRLFVRNIRTKMELTQDQCNYLLDRITIQNEDDITTKMLPYFNPDFHFACTIFQMDNDFPEWKGYTDIHQKSQVALPENLSLNDMQVKAKFAFQQGCRWLLFTLDPLFNSDMNERIAFMLANDKTIKKSSQKVARALLSRDAHTGAFDGKHIYYFIDDIEQFMFVYVRLLSQISPLLRDTKSPCKIIAPSTLQVRSLPKEMADLPPPHEYELILPISNSWHSLLKSQLTTELQQSFSPTIGYGTIYIPQYSNPNCGVLGRTIKSMAKFQHLDVESDSLYFWVIQEAKWEKRRTIEQSLPQDYLEYTSFQPPSEEVQKENHAKSLVFQGQAFDVIRQRHYGSNHYWTSWNRSLISNKITIVPNLVLGTFSYGLNPFKPSIKQDLNVGKILLCHVTANDTQKDLLFQSYLEKECQSCIELAIKYHRLQSIHGFNSASLTWSKPQGSMLPSRIPILLEFLSMQLPQHSENYIRTLPMSQYQWLPKTLIPHVDEETDMYHTSKSKLLEIRNNRNKRLLPTSNTFLPIARQKSFGSLKSFVPPKQKKGRRN